MFENIFIAIATVVVFGGAIAAWWIENGPERPANPQKPAKPSKKPEIEIYDENDIIYESDN
ncbi:MAG: hypothetical protein K6E79_07835 [Pseudobutyrivibrio sp.]|nr:hypothetical protein [Pseudobutyrivibrio sp.]